MELAETDEEAGRHWRSLMAGMKKLVDQAYPPTSDQDAWADIKIASKRMGLRQLFVRANKEGLPCSGRWGHTGTPDEVMIWTCICRNKNISDAELQKDHGAETAEVCIKIMTVIIMTIVTLCCQLRNIYVSSLVYS